jgi:hypothetical protein
LDNPFVFHADFISANTAGVQNFFHNFENNALNQLNCYKKRAGIVLILETVKDRKYWMRLKNTIEHFDLPINTWNTGNAAF